MQEEFPVNVKQVGDIDENLKIYLEDNVLNYLFEYAKKAGYDERVALLLGKKMTIEGRGVVFIEGAILGKYAEEINNILIPSEKTEEYIKQQLGVYFEDMEIVGLMQSQPGYGIYLNPAYKGYMNQNFKKEHQVLFTVDPLEKSMAFYMRDKEGDLREAKGFIIYYEKNAQMVEYIEENPIEADFIMPKQKKLDEDFLEEHEDVNVNDINEKFMKLKSKKASTFERSDKPINVKKLLKDSRNTEEEKTATKNKVSNILIASAVVVIATAAILAGALINSEGRISALERDIEIITNSHIALIQSLQATQEAFAFMQIPEAALIVEDGLSLGEPVVVHESGPPIVPSTNTIVASGQTYIVQPGDSLISISNMFFGENRIYDIMYLNEIEDANTIFAGMLLVIPY